MMYRIVCKLILIVSFLLVVATNAKAVQVTCNEINDSAALQAANDQIVAAGVRSGFDSHIVHNPQFIDLTGNCRVVNTITINSSYVGLRFNGHNIWSYQANQPILKTVSDANSYSTMPMYGVRLQTDGDALIVGSNQLAIYGDYIYSRGKDITIANNGYIVDLNNLHLWGYGAVAIDCPSGLSNAGEKIYINGGAIFNNSVGILNDGACGIFSDGTSFDFNTHPVKDNLGIVQIDHAHIEGNTSTSTEIDFGASAPNNYSHVIVTNSQFFNDAPGSYVLAKNEGSSGAYFEGHSLFISGFTNSSGLDSGSNICLRDVTSGWFGATSPWNIPNVGNCH